VYDTNNISSNNNEVEDDSEKVQYSLIGKTSIQIDKLILMMLLKATNGEKLDLIEFEYQDKLNSGSFKE
jgi:hypothetical protein